MVRRMVGGWVDAACTATRLNLFDFIAQPITFGIACERKP